MQVIVDVLIDVVLLASRLFEVFSPGEEYHIGESINIIGRYGSCPGRLSTVSLVSFVVFSSKWHVVTSEVYRLSLGAVRVPCP